MRIDSRGQAFTKNYPVGEGLCECCKLGIAFADSGKTVYIVDREVDGKKFATTCCENPATAARDSPCRWKSATTAGK